MNEELNEEPIEDLGMGPSWSRPKLIFEIHFCHRIP